jgi:hypothetical protein
MFGPERKFDAVALLCRVVPLTLNFVAGLAAAGGQESSGAFHLLEIVVIGWAFAWWVRRDNRWPPLRGVCDGLSGLGVFNALLFA